jgi:hypothetical protein
MNCTECGQFFTPNGPKQTKCNICRFVKPIKRQRISGVPNPIRWGRIPKWERYEINTIGTVMTENTILMPQEYGSVQLYSPQKGYYLARIGRLLKLTFDPIDFPEKYAAVPKNGNSYDYRLENWEWKEQGNKKLSRQHAEIIRERYFTEENLTQRTLAAQYGVQRSTIRDIINRRIWR